MISNQMNEPTYEEWIDWIFNHEITEPPWYNQDNAPKLDISYLTLNLYLQKLFTEPISELKEFDDEQIGQGLYFIVDDITSIHMYAISSTTVDWDIRKITTSSIYELFNKLFALKCDNQMSEESGENFISMACYMWWDIGLIRGFSANLADIKLVNEIITVIKKTLELSSDACRISALHGLGHLFVQYPNEVVEIIDKFISDNPSISVEVREYAMRAREGNVM
jgi:hypothetical protein